jgi:hypothetical protein
VRGPQINEPTRAGFARVGCSENAQDSHRTISDFAKKPSDLAEGAAKGAAIDPELAELLARWKNLPPDIRSAVLTIARQHPANNT